MEHTQKEKLQWASDRIESVLALHRIPARVTGGNVTPRWIRFHLLPTVGTKISKIKALHEEIAYALNAPTCRVDRRGAAVAVEIPRDNPTPVLFHPLHAALLENTTPPPATALLGMSHDGTPLLIRLTSPDVAHILIAGTTGSGKTVLMQSMITSLALSNSPQDLGLLLVDPKTTAFRHFRPLPHLPRPVVSDTADITELLHTLVHLMETRTHPHPTIVLFIDELADIAMTGGQSTLFAITRLTQRGREAGIHIVAATQKPSASLLGPLIKANFPARIVGKVTSIHDARVATGWSGTGAEHFAGRGDFAAIAEAQLTRFQAPYITPNHIQQLASGLAGAPKCSTLSQGLQPADPPPTTDPNTDHAQQLIHSDLWPDRWADTQHSQYKRGWLSTACQFLFSRPLEGTWHRRTTRIVAAAEQLSQAKSTTTTLLPHIAWPTSALDR